MAGAALRDLEILAVDCQATGASPRTGHLLELAWCRTRAGEGRPPSDLADARRRTDVPTEVASTLVALPSDASVPRRIQSLTGIRPDDLCDAPRADEAWGTLLAARPANAPAVAHWARFERSFFEALHGDAAPLPLEMVCTWEIARRLYPDLPRVGIRAVSGYLGQPLDEMKRARCHVEATIFIWSHLVSALADGPGVSTLDDLRDWLQTRAPKRKRGRLKLPLPRETRLALPKDPGVYRMLGRDGTVLYAGKASNLKRRVNSYFQKRKHSQRNTTEMLVQVYDLDVTACRTPLEAALLEHDEIKRLAPPYNSALRARERDVVFFDRRFETSAHHGEHTPCGPAPDVLSIQLARIVSRVLAGEPLSILSEFEDSWLPTSLADLEPRGDRPPGDLELAANDDAAEPARAEVSVVEWSSVDAFYAAAVAHLRERLSVDGAAVLSPSDLWRIGMRLHREWLAEREAERRTAAEARAVAERDAAAADGESPGAPATDTPLSDTDISSERGVAASDEAECDSGHDDDDDASPSEREPSSSWVWTPSLMARSLLDALRQTVRYELRARWLARLADATIVFHPKGWRAKTKRRFVRLELADVVDAGGLVRGATAPIGECRRTASERRGCYTVARYDRMRVLTTELRRLVGDGRDVAIHFPNGASMDRDDVARLLARL